MCNCPIVRHYVVTARNVSWPISQSVSCASYGGWAAQLNRLRGKGHTEVKGTTDRTKPVLQFDWRFPGSERQPLLERPPGCRMSSLTHCLSSALSRQRTFFNAAWTAATRNRTYPILCTAYLSGGHHIRVRAHAGRHSEEELYLGKQGDPWRLTAWLGFHHIPCTCTTSPQSLRPGKKARRRGVQGGILAAMTP